MSSDVRPMAMPDAVPVAEPRVEAPARRGWIRPVAVTLVIVAVLLLLGGLALYGTGFTWEPLVVAAAAPEEPTKAERSERRALERALRQVAPGGTYVVVDSANNRLWVRRGNEILLEAVVSTGSGLVLRQVDADRTWTFDTPRGMYRIHRRAENPVWVRPDWAFLEEGNPVPKKHSERYDYGVLGEYGLYFGDAYIIHGTLYENLLGRSVSHGCIRVGREDLRKVWKLVPLGTPVIIY